MIRSSIKEPPKIDIAIKERMIQEASEADNPVSGVNMGSL